jgi:hypothetical protein
MSNKTPFGDVIKTHTIGDYIILEHLFGPEQRVESEGQTGFYVQGTLPLQGVSFDTLDQALLGALCMKHTKTAVMFDKLFCDVAQRIPGLFP